MPVEMAAVAFEGTETAKQALGALRIRRDDVWVSEIAVLEHESGGRFSMLAPTPEYSSEDDHTGAGIAIGGGTGLLLGLIGGPVGLLFWGAMGAVAGGAIGKSSRHGAFDPLVEEVRDLLPPDSSALMLVAETPTTETFVAEVETGSRQTVREPLSREQLDELTGAAVPA